MGEALPEAAEQASSRWRGLALGAVVLITAVARVWVIQRYPEPDGDAKGHLGIAVALLADPLNVAVHWVWPPGYHYFLAAMLAVGVTAQGIRLLNCALAAILPLLVWRYGERTIDPSSSPSARHVPLLAGLLVAVMPIVNLLGVSAQQETLFTILVLTAAWSIDADRFTLGGVLLAIAGMVRYEAWGAVALLTGLRAVGFVPALVTRLPAPIARICRLPLVVIVPSFIAIGGWFLAHRLSDGSWFGFIREIQRHTGLQRQNFQQDLLWFPVITPYYLFGATLPLFFLGLRRAFRPGFLVPFGIYVFLVVSYTFKGALGSARYYESVTPFLCIAAAHGAASLGDRRRWALPLAFGVAFTHVAWLLVSTGRWTFHG